MKNLLLCIILVISINLYAQEKPPDSILNNEVKLNVGYLLAGYPELAYERIINDESAVGISGGFWIIEDGFINFYKYSFVPYYRIYSRLKRAAGFFVELNGILFSQEYYKKNKRLNCIGLGLGSAIGMKFIISDGWIGELYGGLS
ncbi:MAG: hypothetical protein U9Q98_00835 [Bacteroidota bacterium]|nr:hypothetical protein [Bacteroidota bacterium]